MTKAAIRYHTNRQYIYRWSKRYDGTLKSLEDRSHRPHSHPNQHRPDEIKLIQDMRRRNPNFVREDFRRLEDKGVKCTINFPIHKAQRVTMWSLIPQKLMPPTRAIRYCCSVLKEQPGKGRFITTGVRWAESKKRRENRGIYETLSSDKAKKIILNNDNDDRRRLFETCTLKAKRVCNPIIDWTDRDIWEYIRAGPAGEAGLRAE